MTPLANTEYKTIIARRPVVSKIEQYRKRRGLPSKSQALAAMTEEVERKEQILSFIRDLLTRLHNMIENFKATGSKTSQQFVNSLADLVKLLMEQLSAQLVQP